MHIACTPSSRVPSFKCDFFGVIRARALPLAAHKWGKVKSTKEEENDDDIDVAAAAAANTDAPMITKICSHAILRRKQNKSNWLYVVLRIGGYRKFIPILQIILHANSWPP
jgi:hypothetical protein